MMSVNKKPNADYVLVSHISPYPAREICIRPLKPGLPTNPELSTTNIGIKVLYDKESPMSGTSSGKIIC